AYLGGTTLDQLAPEHHGQDREADRALRRRVVVSAFFFVLGLGTVFVLLGMGASALGQAMLRYKDDLAMVSGALIIALGVHFLGLIRIPFLGREARFEGPAQAGNCGTSYLIGVAFAFGWTPCIGPILASILTLAAQQDTLTSGTALLAVYAAGLGMPFLLAAFFIGPFLRWAHGFRRHMGTVEKVMGGLLIVVGLMIMTGEFERLAWWLLETFPILATLG
ncbi:MAG: cytochrome c biogenesis protein CcdA, partial [Pseudomonadota bacterium]